MESGPITPEYNIIPLNQMFSYVFLIIESYTALHDDLVNILLFYHKSFTVLSTLGNGISPLFLVFF